MNFAVGLFCYRGRFSRDHAVQMRRNTCRLSSVQAAENSPTKLSAMKARGLFRFDDTDQLSLMACPV